MSFSDSPKSSIFAGKTAVAVGAVLSMHAAVLWAFHSGLLKRPPEVKPPEAIQVSLIAPPPPEITPPKPDPVVAQPPPPTKAKPKPAPPKPQAQPKPAPAPQPLASTNTSETAMAVPAAAPAQSQVSPAPSPPAPPAPPAPPTITAPSKAGHLTNPIEYPHASRRLGEEGVTVLRVLVTADGRAGDVELKRTSGFDRLDQAALRSVRKWRFAPATKNGEPFEMWFDQPVKFELKS